MTDGSSGFSTRVVLAVVAVAALCLGAVAVLSAWAPDLRDGDDGRAHALSRSAVGYAGLVRLLRATDRPVVLLRGAPSPDQDGLLILTPERSPDARETDVLLSEGGMVLIILPKWEVAPSPTRKGWVQKLAPLPTPVAARALPDGLPPVTVSEGRDVARVRVFSGGRRLGETDRIEGLRSVSGAGWRPVLVDDQGRVLVAVSPEHGAMVTAEPDLFATHVLDDPAAADTAVAVIDDLRAGRPLLIDLTLAGFTRPRNVLRLMLEPPLLGFTLCLLAAALLVSWQAAIRFGPPRRPTRAIALGKKALADNTAALARLARKEHRMAPAYVEAVRRSALRRAAVPPTMPTQRADALLDQIAARNGETVTLAQFAERARNSRNAADLVALAQDLFRWKGKITHASR